MRTLALDTLAKFLARRTDVVFAVVFGSAQNGVIAPESDLDLGVCFEPTPTLEERVAFMAEIADMLEFDAIDLTDLGKADPILAFEAISGRFLCKNSRAKTAAFCSLVCREYEDVKAILQDARKREKESGRPVVSRTKREPALA